MVTERVRRERGHWRGGGWSRASREWGERRRTGRAIRSCPGPTNRDLLRSPIPTTSRRGERRSSPRRKMVQIRRRSIAPDDEVWANNYSIGAGLAFFSLKFQNQDAILISIIIITSKILCNNNNIFRYE